MIYEHPFSVRGTHNSLITYWYELLLGFNFLASSHLKVLLVPDSGNKDKEEEDVEKCLLDKSCVQATLASKNMLKIDVILTSGKYRLVFMDEEQSGYISANLKEKPFTFKLTSYPVL